jgi:hypothetical protein
MGIGLITEALASNADLAGEDAAQNAMKHVGPLFVLHEQTSTSLHHWGARTPSIGLELRPKPQSIIPAWGSVDLRQRRCAGERPAGIHEVLQVGTSALGVPVEPGRIGVAGS